MFRRSYPWAVTDGKPVAVVNEGEADEGPYADLLGDPDVRPTPRRALAALFAALLALGAAACGDDADTPTGTNQGGTTGAEAGTGDENGGENVDGDLPESDDDPDAATDDTTTAETTNDAPMEGDNQATDD